MEDDPRDNKLDRLFADARKAELYRQDLEQGFEARVITRIRAEGEARPPFFVWAWRLIPVFVSIVIVLGIWTYLSESNQRIDLTAVASIGSEDTMLTAYLTGE